MTRRLSLRLNPLLEQLEGEAEACKKAKKSKNLPRGDYKEFVQLISVCFIVVSVMVNIKTYTILPYQYNSFLFFIPTQIREGFV